MGIPGDTFDKGDHCGGFGPLFFDCQSKSLNIIGIGYFK